MQWHQEIVKWGAPINVEETSATEFLGRSGTRRLIRDDDFDRRVPLYDLFSNNNRFLFPE